MICPETFEEFLKLNPHLRETGYEEVGIKAMEQVDILHLYPSLLRGDENGRYWDSRFFQVWMFDIVNMRACKSIRHHDALVAVKAHKLMVYQDGSIFLRLMSPVDPKEFSSQAPYLGEPA